VGRLAPGCQSAGALAVLAWTATSIQPNRSPNHQNKHKARALLSSSHCAARPPPHIPPAAPLQGSAPTTWQAIKKQQRVSGRASCIPGWYRWWRGVRSRQFLQEMKHDARGLAQPGAGTTGWQVRAWLPVRWRGKTTSIQPSRSPKKQGPRSAQQQPLLGKTNPPAAPKGSAPHTTQAMKKHISSAPLGTCYAVGACKVCQPLQSGAIASTPWRCLVVSNTVATKQCASKGCDDGGPRQDWRDPQNVGRTPFTHSCCTLQSGAAQPSPARGVLRCKVWALRLAHAQLQTGLSHRLQRQPGSAHPPDAEREGGEEGGCGPRKQHVEGSWRARALLWRGLARLAVFASGWHAHHSQLQRG